ncbi:glycosyltransferase [Bacillus paranthracis]|uniref:glycosyltransferase n=1 Tax=Bacillus TaxID=1386 RepID=UPI000772BD8F|nr:MULTISPECIES: glycosyltransferase [Bacillus cereus group]KXI35557.1 hypothetical protein ACS53_27575 [Bacillus cereus]MCR6790678.1 glycosyltransferase [Bacillus paranthracis]MCU5016894.1 glycosyltransferase [Bacillus paranthracis]MDA2194209.1 glycosyltransferase [Bacillus cereus group sp. Bc238]MDA2199952.1 glycosyltransferase [Bacillus cereus group sp. Bc237]
MVDLDAKEFVGIKKKVMGQKEALNFLGKCDLLYVRANGLYLNQEKVLDFLNYKDIYNYILNSSFLSEYDLCYIRHLPPMSFSYFNFLRGIKKNPNLKVILEIPTFPYYGERSNAQSVKNKLNFYLDQFCFSKLISQYIDHIVTFNYFEDTVFGIENIKLVNGISESQMPLIKKEKSNLKEINILAVSTLVSWHAYDRLILGLNEYKDKGLNEYTIKLHFVGEGPERNNLENLTNDLSLNEFIYFYGYKNGDELEEIYGESDIGVSSLGLFKKGGAGDSLKAKEYMLAGLPIIVDENEKYYLGKEFVLDIPSNGNPIDLEQVVKFYNSITSQGSEIREFCLENFSWNRQIEKLLEIVEK